MSASLEGNLEKPQPMPSPSLRKSSNAAGIPPGGKMKFLQQDLPVELLDETHLHDEAKRVYEQLQLNKFGETSKTDLESLTQRIKEAYIDMGIHLKDEYYQHIITEMIQSSKGEQNTKGIITFEEFEESLKRGFDLMRRARNVKLILPDFDNFCEKIKGIYEEVKPIKSGKNASYIPQLAKMDPNLWSVAIETVDGQSFSHGNGVDVEFSVQSCGKPVTYCMACEELGIEEVHKYVGCEPSGAHFNAFTLTESHKPFNPFVNTGAIMTCSLIERQLNAAERFAKTQSFFRKMASGSKVGFSNSIFLSEKSTADRNRALAYFMNEHGAFPHGTNIEDVLDFYFQTCSMEVTVKTMASIAACLANGGISPKTGKRLLSTETVKKCLILMFSCGMYDYSGSWAFNVGLPAKSGVSGCIFVVIPNVMGLCTFSPRLDHQGNSVRGIEFCKRLTTNFNFHIFTQLVGLDLERPLTNKHTKSGTKQLKKANGNQHESSMTSAAFVALLCTYASQGDLEELRNLVALNSKKHCDLSIGDYDKRTPLHLAASEGHLDCVQFLVERGASVNVADRWGKTPLDDAKYGEHKLVIEYLKEKGAVSDRRSGKTVLEKRTKL